MWIFRLGLERLYRRGYQSDVIDLSIDKLLMLERAAAQHDLESLEQRLRDYEERYQMSSAEFHERFRAGQTGDEIDWVEWSVFYEMHRAVQERLSILMAEASEGPPSGRDRSRPAPLSPPSNPVSELYHCTNVHCTNSPSGKDIVCTGGTVVQWGRGIPRRLGNAPSRSVSAIPREGGVETVR